MFVNYFLYASVFLNSFLFIFLIKEIKSKSSLNQELSNLKNKFKSNPSYESQLLMADILNGHMLFHIERIPPESVLIKRDN